MRYLVSIVTIAASVYITFKLVNYIDITIKSYVKTEKEIKDLSYVPCVPSAIPNNCGLKLSAILIGTAILVIEGIFFLTERDNPLHMSSEVIVIVGAFYSFWLFNMFYKSEKSRVFNPDAASNEESHNVAFLFFASFVMLGIAKLLSNITN